MSGPAITPFPQKKIFKKTQNIDWYMERAEVLHTIFPQLLLARLTFRNPRSQRPGEKTGMRCTLDGKGLGQEQT